MPTSRGWYSTSRVRSGGGFDEILAPGEPEIRTRQQRMREGIAIDDTAWGKICAAAERYGVRLTASE